ncbi:hypothetical protein B0H17DRAFT_1228802 [Mycena rosella]|uniref:Uncharacterized protein n=1 Tax=Mycena rosella TaxID=1033263 RepID=A0AAD7D7D6_MYCRO|nr:hypothetical protein B0H17DRAFT_1228802 [Mycena rosella]
MPAPTAIALESLDQLKSALKIVAALSDGAINLPCLRAAAGAAIEIIDIAQVVTKNKQDAIEVAKSAAERTSSLLDALKGNSMADIPLESQQAITRYAEFVPLRLECLGGFPHLKALHKSTRSGIFIISSFLSSYTWRAVNQLVQLQSFITAQAPVQPKLSIIRREELDLRECWRLDATTGVVFAEYNGNRVVVKKYGPTRNNGIRRLVDPYVFIGLTPAYGFRFRQPHYLQIIGQSEENARAFHIVFRGKFFPVSHVLSSNEYNPDPGIPVQNYIKNECQSGLKKCNTMNGPNFVLVHFNPSHFFKPTAKDQDIVSDGWDIFVNLITKVGNSRSKHAIFLTSTVNHGKYFEAQSRYRRVWSVNPPSEILSGIHQTLGETGPTATRVFRFLIHFLIDFRYHDDRQHEGLSEAFRKLTSDISAIRSEVENLDSSSNPLLDSMQRYFPSLCAIWDLWKIIPAHPSDLGLMLPGDFRQWFSEQGQTLPMVTSYPEYAEQQYIPTNNPACWSSETVDSSTIRLADTYLSANVGVKILSADILCDSEALRLAPNLNTGELSVLATLHNVNPDDLILIFSTSESKGYTHIILETIERCDALLTEVGAKDRLLCYFENLAAGEGELHGYWSSSEAPGQPLWGGSPRAQGPDWGWEYSYGDFKVEIGR